MFKAILFLLVLVIGVGRGLLQLRGTLPWTRICTSRAVRTLATADVSELLRVREDVARLRGGVGRLPVAPT
jgi:hypothetical protein